MDNVRFNKLVDRVRTVRLLNSGKDMSHWNSVDDQYSYVEALAIRGSYNLTQINRDKSLGVDSLSTRG